MLQYSRQFRNTLHSDLQKKMILLCCTDTRLVDLEMYHVVPNNVLSYFVTLILGQLI